MWTFFSYSHLINIAQMTYAALLSCVYLNEPLNPMPLASSLHLSFEMLHILSKPDPVSPLPAGSSRFSVWCYSGPVKLVCGRYLRLLPTRCLSWGWSEYCVFQKCVTGDASENILALGCRFVCTQDYISSFSETLSLALLLNSHVREILWRAAWT